MKPIIESPPRMGALHPATPTAVTDQIKQYIVDQNLKTGDPMPTEVELCESLGVSRSKVREAIRTLVALDIVSVRHGYGTYVGNMSLSPFVEALTFKGKMQQEDSFQLLFELLDVREAFDISMADQVIAATHEQSSKDLDTIVQAMEQSAQAGQSFLVEDRLFHTKLLEGVGNTLIAQLVGAFWDVYTRTTPLMDDASVAENIETAHMHREILDAVNAGRADQFRMAVHRHYDPVRKRLRASVERSR